MTTDKKPKAAWVCSTPVSPATAKERIKISRSMKAHHERLRRKYKEVHGKKVDWISHTVEDGCMYFTVRFKDKTAIHFEIRPELLIDGIELSDWSSGDDKILRTYYRRRVRSS
jgi:hypothetical protein